MKKRLIAIIALFLLTFQVWGQENIRLTQYFQNPQFFNPGFSGIESFLDVKIGHKQNVGAYEMAPQTTFLSVNAPFNASRKRATELYSLRISNPNIYSRLANVKISAVKHGLGGVLISEKQGPFSQQHVMLSYATHFLINQKLRMSAGVSAFYFRNRVNTDQIILGEDGIREDPIKDYYTLNNIIYSRMGVNAGLLFYTDDFYLGYTLKNIYQNDFDISSTLTEGNTTLENKMAHSIQAGYKFKLDDNLTLLPGFYVNYYPKWPLVYTLNAKIRYNNQYWGGLAYSSSGSLSLIAGLKIKEFLNLSYSYDYTVSGLSNYVSGSHEIILGFMLIRNGGKKTYMW